MKYVLILAVVTLISLTLAGTPSTISIPPKYQPRELPQLCTLIVDITGQVFTYRSTGHDKDAALLKFVAMSSDPEMQNTIKSIINAMYDNAWYSKNAATDEAATECLRFINH